MMGKMIVTIITDESTVVPIDGSQSQAHLQQQYTRTRTRYNRMYYSRLIIAFGHLHWINWRSGRKSGMMMRWPYEFFFLDVFDELFFFL